MYDPSVQVTDPTYDLMLLYALIIVIDRLKSIAVFNCVSVSFGVEFEDCFEAVALVF